MFEVFKRYSHVDDVFIARKRNVQGKRFGFATFMGVRDPTAFEKELRTICIGTQKSDLKIKNLGRCCSSPRLLVLVTSVYVYPVDSVIMESLVKKKQKGAILELKRRYLKKVLNSINTPYPTRKIRRICASSSQERVLINSRSGVNMDDPNITIEEYIRLEEEKARKRGKVYNWETAKYGKIWYDEDVHDLRSVETEFPAIVFDDAFTSEVTPYYEPTVSPLNDNKIDFRISFDESDDEDYTDYIRR
ncbi:hypothetical protein Tco_0174186 [Tanacetum coccineum]